MQVGSEATVRVCSITSKCESPVSDVVVEELDVMFDVRSGPFMWFERHGFPVF